MPYKVVLEGDQSETPGGTRRQVVQGLNNMREGGRYFLHVPAPTFPGKRQTGTRLWVGEAIKQSEVSGRTVE